MNKKTGIGRETEKELSSGAEEMSNSTETSFSTGKLSKLFPT